MLKLSSWEVAMPSTLMWKKCKRAELKSVRKWILQKCYQFFIGEKLKKLSHFPPRILPNYVPHEITKEFWKNIHFWKDYSWFSSEMSKLTSVRNKLNLLLKYWFIEAKIAFCVFQGSPKWSKYQLDTIQTTFSENNNY